MSIDIKQTFALSLKWSIASEMFGILLDKKQNKP